LKTARGLANRPDLAAGFSFQRNLFLCWGIPHRPRQHLCGRVMLFQRDSIFAIRVAVAPVRAPALPPRKPVCTGIRGSRLPASNHSRYPTSSNNNGQTADGSYSGARLRAIIQKPLAFSPSSMLHFPWLLWLGRGFLPALCRRHTWAVSCKHRFGL
jgi:hypothetical protein